MKVEKTLKIFQSFRNAFKMWVFTKRGFVRKRHALQRITNSQIPRMGALLRLHAAKSTALQVTIAHRRRLAAAVLLDSPPKLACGPQGPKDLEQDRIDWDKHFAKLNDRDFEKRYRLSKTAFMDTYEHLRSMPRAAARSLAAVVRCEIFGLCSIGFHFLYS